MSKIGIINYGMGNLRSVQKAFEIVGHAADIIHEPKQIEEAEKIVLPGVGAFRDAIARLQGAQLATPIVHHIKEGKPFLGICLGLQLLFTRSYEDGEHAGLAVFEGDVVHFPEKAGLKVPHMGWNQLRLRKPSAVFAERSDGSFVYFVHSYFAVPRDESMIAATADYPTPFTAAISKGNVFATQFHPEKSQNAGLEMLKQFAEMSP